MFPFLSAVARSVEQVTILLGYLMVAYTSEFSDGGSERCRKSESKSDDDEAVLADVDFTGPGGRPLSWYGRKTQERSAFAG